MALAVANGVWSAVVFNEAGVHTFGGSGTSTDFRICALMVTLAADWLTLNLRIAESSGGTLADGSVTRDETLRTLSAVARVAAESVLASLVLGTVVISDAARRVGDVNRFTRLVRIWHPAFATLADHSSEGSRVDYLAHCRLVAGCEDVAWVATLGVEASQSGSAIGVDEADGLDLGSGSQGQTRHKWISEEATGADARGDVVRNPAGGAGRAGVVQVTGVQALVTHTSLVGGTVAVDLALDSLAALEWITKGARGTDAGGGVGSGLALGVVGAGIFHETGVDTLVVVANLIIATFSVNSALNCRDLKKTIKHLYSGKKRHKFNKFLIFLNNFV